MRPGSGHPWGNTADVEIIPEAAILVRSDGSVVGANGLTDHSRSAPGTPIAGLLTWGGRILRKTLVFLD